MDAFGSAFLSTIRDYVGLYEENKKLKQQLNDEKAINQALNVCKVSGPGGTPVYATGARPDFDMTDPRSWEDVGGEIRLKTLVPVDGDGNPQHFLIEDIPKVEVHVGNRLFCLAKARVKLMGYASALGFVAYMYIFPISPGVELSLVVNFNVNPELVAGWEANGIPDIYLDPSNFRNDQIKCPLKFDRIWCKNANEE